MTVQPLNRLQIAWRTAQDVETGMLVNLGLGMPVAVGDYLKPGVDVFIQSENGVVGVGPVAPPDKIDTDLVDAGSRRVTLRPGASFVDSSWSFAMIRGGHIDVAVLGAFEVAANGDLANWDMRIPNRGPLVGGGMDLAACAGSVWIVMEHVTRKGAPRLLETCTLPLTAVRCVTRVYTDLAVIDVTPKGFVVREMLDGLSEADLRARTGAPLTFAPDCRPLATPAIALPD
ncbi:3-oxoacid CoA-transferase subunit B [Rhodoplanes sp. Z2-YC6860]|uniref:3-oxoacid CoA-transferase subunit B n=1 Tax=Rhodoplanes sp. Z2-YC6860 TaxID=674703 RepID=UPI00078B4D77|nr:3-oxoacid CoA-transferase subunit B [Rhodoplanes sp. Z2-YC6860]AMN40644.1 3-oxoadipate CoA-transferase subunit B [Rhodoplanes sp. Z2-YC6860]